MPLGPAENLTPEQVTELVLTLTGRLQAALEAPLEERGTAQRRMIDALIYYWPTLRASTTAGKVLVPRLLASGIGTLLVRGRLDFSKFDIGDPRVQVIGPSFLTDNMDYSKYTADAAFWWRKAVPPGPVASAGTGGAGASWLPAKRKEANEAEVQGRAKRAKKDTAGKKYKSAEIVDSEDDVPLKDTGTSKEADQGEAGKKPGSSGQPGPEAAEASKKAGKEKAGHEKAGQEKAGQGKAGNEQASKEKAAEVRVEPPLPVFACDYCRNRKLKCRYYKDTVGGRCGNCVKGHGICTLNTKSLVTGRPMKGPAAERKAVMFRAFAEALRAQGLSVPTLSLWDERCDLFIADLKTLDGRAKGAHPELVEWIRARNAAEAAGKNLPEYKADREPRKGSKAKGKKAVQEEDPVEVDIEDEDLGQQPPDPPMGDVQEAEAQPSTADMAIPAPSPHAEGGQEQPTAPAFPVEQAPAPSDAIPAPVDVAPAQPDEALGGLGLTNLMHLDMAKAIATVEADGSEETQAEKAHRRVRRLRPPRVYMEIDSGDEAGPSEPVRVEKAAASLGSPIIISDAEPSGPETQPARATLQTGQRESNADVSEGETGVSPAGIMLPPASQVLANVSYPAAAAPPIKFPQKPTARMAQIISNVNWLLTMVVRLKDAEEDGRETSKQLGEAVADISRDWEARKPALETIEDELCGMETAVDELQTALEELQKKFAQEKQRRRQLQEKLDELVAEQKSLRKLVGTLEGQVVQEAEAALKQSRRIARLEARLDDLRVPNAQAIVNEVVERTERTFSGRMESLQMSFFSMTKSMEDREKLVEDIVRQQAEEAARLENHLMGLVEEHVNRAQWALRPKLESPEPDVRVAPQDTSLTPAATSRQATPATTSTPRPALRETSTPQPTPAVASVRQPTPAGIALRQATPAAPSHASTPSPPSPGTNGQVTALHPSGNAPTPGPSVPRHETSPFRGSPVVPSISAILASPARSAVNIPSASPPIAMRVQSLAAVTGYTGRADGGPPPSTWVSPAEQAKAKTKVVSQYSLRSRSRSIPPPGLNEAIDRPCASSVPSRQPMPEIHEDAESDMDLSH